MSSFLDLPGEIRNLIYDHLLVFDQPIVPWVKEQALPIGLLFANKTTNREFGSLFYSRITFDFSSAHAFNCEEHQCHACSTKRIISFLHDIGENAKDIRSIKTDFPLLCCETNDDDDDGIFIAVHSVEIVEKIRSNCPNLKELMVGPVRTLNVIFHIAFHDLEEALYLLNEVDNHFRKISSIEKIKVRVPDFEEHEDVWCEMEYLGWEVELIDPYDSEWMSDYEHDEDEDDDDDDDDEDDDEDFDDYEPYDDEDDEDDDDTDEEEVMSTTIVLPSR